MHDGHLLRFYRGEHRGLHGLLFNFWAEFDACLEHLTQIPDACVKKRLVLCWEKSHFMEREGIVLGHLVSSKGLEVDKAKVVVI